MLDQQLYQGGGPSLPQTEEVSDEPQLQVEEETEDYACVVVAPLPPGFGITLGNTLRRVLLSSLPGAAVTSVRIDGVLHEFSAIPDIKEDTVEFLLNVKELRLRPLADRPGTLVLDISGRQGEVIAADIQVPEHYEIFNPELHLATMDSAKGQLHVEFNAETGSGYQPAGQSEGLPIGTIPVDAIFSPVRKVNYRVEHTRVGQSTNYDKLILEVWTDGTMRSADAVSQSADIIIEQFGLFSDMGRLALPVVERGLGAGLVLAPEKYKMPIEDLQLSMRAYNCLRRSGLMTVGQILEKSEEELLALRNFGRKSYDELKNMLDEMGLLSKEQPEEAIMEAPLLGDEETPFTVARPSVKAGTAPVAEAPAEVKEQPGAEDPSEEVEAAAAVESPDRDEELPEWQRKLRILKGAVGEEGEPEEGQ